MIRTERGCASTHKSGRLIGCPVWETSAIAVIIYSRSSSRTFIAFSIAARLTSPYPHGSVAPGWCNPHRDTQRETERDTHRKSHTERHADAHIDTHRSCVSALYEQKTRRGKSRTHGLRAGGRVGTSTQTETCINSHDRARVYASINSWQTGRLTD